MKARYSEQQIKRTTNRFKNTSRKREQQIGSPNEHHDIANNKMIQKYITRQWTTNRFKRKLRYSEQQINSKGKHATANNKSIQKYIIIQRTTNRSIVNITIRTWKRFIGFSNTSNKFGSGRSNRDAKYGNSWIFFVFKSLPHPRSPYGNNNGKHNGSISKESALIYWVRLFFVL